MKRIFKKIMISLVGLVSVGILGITTFFYTDVFEKYRDLWVQTAMSTTSHKWLATTFLSEDEIDDIMAKYTVTNTTNSSSDSVSVTQLSTASTKSTNSTTIKQISGSTYQGYVVTITDPTKVNLTTNLDDSGQGQLVSETLAQDSSIKAVLNAGGFNFGRGRSSTLNSATIIDGELIYGDSNTQYQFIGMSKEGKLILGNYTYAEALAAGMDDAIDFGPYLLVNGEDQVAEEGTGGLQPRSAIGQAADGTIYLVLIEGRSTSSAGASLYDLQEIMKDLGAVNAANLDGGGSSELFYDGDLVNSLSNGSERAMTTVFTVSE